MVHANIINDNKEIHEILVSKAKENTYYLMYDDIFFEKIKKKENIRRQLYTISRRITNCKNRIKHISSKLKQ